MTGNLEGWELENTGRLKGWKEKRQGAWRDGGMETEETRLEEWKETEEKGCLEGWKQNRQGAWRNVNIIDKEPGGMETE